MLKKKAKYYGITHEPLGYQSKEYGLYKCSKGIHAFDEVLSIDHYLHCDVCGLKVYIERIEK